MNDPVSTVGTKYSSCEKVNPSVRAVAIVRGSVK